jgi:hypothetical protein
MVVHTKCFKTLLFMRLAFISFSLLVVACLLFSSCKHNAGAEEEQGNESINSKIVFTNHSAAPPFVKTAAGFEGVEVFTLISSNDVLPQSPQFVFGAQPDGAGLLKDPNGDGYVLLNNHEVLRSVSRLYLDASFKPVKGEYILDAEGGMWRLCSATMAKPEEHGFGPLFITAGETGPDSRVHAIDPLAPASDRKRTDRVKPALGRASMENALPLAKDAYNGKTVILMGEDDTDAQLVMYVSNTVGDLDGGKLYFLRRTNSDPIENNMTLGTTYDVEFVEIENAATATGTEIAAQSIAKKAMQFGRVEDLDYRKGGGAASREIYFAVTGLKNATGKSMWGRMYQLVMDAGSPLKGKLTPVADGATAPGQDLINPDNICATDNYVYIQEDGDSYYTGASHDSYVWQYNIATKQYKPFITTHQRRDDAQFNSVNGYNQTGNNRLGSWEFGAMHDVSRETGVPGTFLLNIHAHTWRNDKFLNADGTTITGSREGGQVVILKGVPR